MNDEVRKLVAALGVRVLASGYTSSLAGWYGGLRVEVNVGFTQVVVRDALTRTIILDIMAPIYGWSAPGYTNFHGWWVRVTI
jgi:hypothetical protein